MHHTYLSSTLLSLGTKGSLSFSFNDHSNLLNERFERNPLLQSSSQCCTSCCCSCCSTCACCASSSFTAIHRVPINPSLLYGLRQSTLIQCSPSRRLILRGRDRYYYRVPAYGIDHGCHEVSCSFEEKRGSERIVGRRKGGFKGINTRERHCFSRIDDVEAVISLLCEEVSEELLGDGETSNSLSKRVDMDKRGNCCGAYYRGRKKKNAGLGLLESDSNCEFESAKVEFRKEEGLQREGREEKKEVLKEKNRRGREASSSFSSYYSLSSTGGFESDEEVKCEYVDCLEESSSGHRKDFKSGEDSLERRVGKEFKGYRDGTKGQGEVLGSRTSARTGVEWDLRKKSEKKLSEIEETQSRKESSQMQSRIARIHDSDHKTVSSSHKQINDKEYKALTVNLEKDVRKQYGQTGYQIKEQSDFRRNYGEIADTRKISGITVETASQSQNRFIGREDTLETDANLVREGRGERHTKFSETAEQNNIRRTSHQVTDTSKIENVSAERVSNLQRQSESRMKILEEDRALCSFHEANQKQLQMGEQTTRQVESRKSSQHLSKRGEIHDGSRKSTSMLQSETRMKKQEGSKSVTSSSIAEAIEHQSHTDQNSPQRMESRKGPGDVTNVSLNVTNLSLVHASNLETVTNFGRTSEKKIIDEGSESMLAVKPIHATREREDKIEENATQFKTRNEVHWATNASRLNETTTQEAFDSQASVNMVSQDRLQQVYMEEGNQRTSQATMMPPVPQLFARGSLQDNPPSGIANQDVSSETSESGSSALYKNSGGRTAVFQQEDALGSAHRLEASSQQFVGEFVEKARHEMSTLESQKEKAVSDTKLVYEIEKQRRKSSEELKLKRRDSRRSSWGSGERGPSDEMWHVKDPSVQEPLQTEAPAGSTAAESIVVRRTGKSLWSIISNIVRLRWARAETPKSTRRSGGKSSSNNSVSSEVWFSGHEPDENSDENVKQERRKMPKEAASSHQLQLTEAASQTQVIASDTIGSKDVTRQFEADTSSPSIALKSGSTSKGIPSPSDEENLGWSQGGNNFQVAASSMVIGESSLVTLPSSDVEESLGTDKTNLSVGESMEMMEQPVNENLTEVLGSKGKDVDVKPRRLQRNKQVLRDSFDEWEEAYMHKSELRKNDEIFMREALLEAKKAADSWEVPVGAVLVHHGKIIARGYNLVEELRDSTAHAEMICIREASNKLRSWRLAETTLYVTLEPCPMCAGAILQARISTLVWGAPNKLLGADGSWIRLFRNGGEGNDSELADKPAPPVHPFHPKMTIRRGILESECADVMQQFFQLRRRKREKKEDSPPQPSCLPIANPQSRILSKMHDIFHGLFCL